MGARKQACSVGARRSRLNEPYRVPVGPAATRYIRRRPKLIAGDKGFWVSLFWDFVGQVMAGLTFLICVPRYPRAFLGLFKQKLAAVGLIALSKILFSVSVAVTLYATLLAPVGSSREFVPARFVFALGIVLTLFYPCIAKESLGGMKMLQKGALMGLTLAGGCLISKVSLQRLTESKEATCCRA